MVALDRPRAVPPAPVGAARSQGAPVRAARSQELHRGAPVGIVPTHPAATPDPAVLSWTVPDGLLAFVGPVGRGPAPLQELLDSGLLDRVEVLPGSVLTSLAPGRTWGADGSRVRSGLVAALAAPEGWTCAEGSRTLDRDAALEAAARQIADGVVGEFARSHGGRITVLGCTDGVVEVEMGGACDGCAAATITLHARLEHLLRARCPWLREVREARGTVAPHLAQWLGGIGAPRGAGSDGQGVNVEKIDSAAPGAGSRGRVAGGDRRPTARFWLRNS